MITPGTRLGPYEIVSLVGTGGMGEVYRARDARLQRDVAIKVLPAIFATDTDRLARFEREAQVLASLNHPHIAHVYGIEESVSSDAGVTVRGLVMELVEGETLAERLANGALSVEELLPLARQLADALETAHEHGVIHRDLKPANIKLTPDGAVKVLDFGLAKALDPLESSRDVGSAMSANSPTITTPAMTRAGVILGTAAYMSPEQARGKPVDKRADIWAFGLVLYEMLTGRSAFHGETVTDTLAAVLRADIDLSLLPGNTPSTLRRLVARCLERDPRQRLRDIGDARIELEQIASRGGAEPPGEAPSRTQSGWRRHALVGFAAGVAVASLAVAAWSLRTSASAEVGQPMRFLISARDGVPLDEPVGFGISPNGQQIALRGSEGGSSYWYVRSLVDGSVRRLDNTRGTTGPTIFWSPDSREIVFSRSGSLFRVAIDDSTARRIVTEQPPLQGTWSTTGDIPFASNGRLFLLSAEGRQPRLLLQDDTARVGYVLPSVLPGGQRTLITIATGAGPKIGVITLAAPATPQVIGDGGQAAFVEPGWILAVRNGQLIALPFDAESATVTGEAVTIRSDVRPRPGEGGRLFSASSTVLALRSNDQAIAARLAWFDRNGGEGAPLRLEHHCRNPEIAPDGSRIAIECYEPGTNLRDIWLYDVGRDVASRLTKDPADDSDPVWSSDGRSVIFSSSRGGPVDVYRMSAGGAAAEELVAETPSATPTMALHPDGKHLAVLDTATMDLHTFEMGTKESLKPLVAGPFVDIELQFSPDGRFFSYSSDESGRPEIYVQAWPPNGEKWQVSVEGGLDARWRPDGKELFYLSPQRELMAVTIDTGKTFRAGTPARLFETRITGQIGLGHRFPYAVSRDGKRFLMYVSTGQTGRPAAVDVIVNWPALIPRQSR